MSKALKKVAAPKVETPKAGNPVLETLRSVDVEPVSKADLECKVSKRGIAALVALAIAIGYKVEKKSFSSFAEMTSAYRHGENTKKPTIDGGSNNMVYIRHATLGLQGTAGHQWAKNVIEKMTEKEVASVVKALGIDKKALVKAAKASKNPLAQKLAKVA